MKHFIVCLLLASLFASCKKHSEEPPPISADYWGEASALKNGKPWTAHPVCWIDVVNHKTLVIELDSFYNVNHLAESLDFVNVPPEPGTYKPYMLTYDAIMLQKLHSTLGLWDDDQSLGGYDVLETESTNQIVLESLDTISKEIRGTFNLTYIIHGDHIQGWPDTVRLTDGKFYGKLIKK